MIISISRLITWIRRLILLKRNRMFIGIKIDSYIWQYLFGYPCTILIDLIYYVQGVSLAVHSFYFVISKMISIKRLIAWIRSLISFKRFIALSIISNPFLIPFRTRPNGFILRISFRMFHSLNKGLTWIFNAQIDWICNIGHYIDIKKRTIYEE